MGKIEKREKAISGLECCMFTECEKCPYTEPTGTCSTLRAMFGDELDVIREGVEAPGRVLTREEALNQTGHGWVELWFEPDEETGEPDYKELREGAWCKGCYILGDADISTSDYTASFYGKKYGVRFWTAKPTDEGREAAAWQLCLTLSAKPHPASKSARSAATTAKNRWRTACKRITT